MGIRFRCHHCETELHVKDFQAGKRGRCPHCDGAFRIPLEDAPHSLDSQPKSPEPSVSVSRAKASLADTENPAQEEFERDAKAGHQAKASNSADTASQATADAAPSGGGQADNSDGASAAIGSGATTGSTGPASVDPSLSSPPQAPPPQSDLPRALQTANEIKWYVRPPSGGQYGPASSTTMWQWLIEHRVGSDALVWAEGWPEWVIAETAFDDFFKVAPSLASDAPPVPPQATGKLKLGTSLASNAETAADAPAETLLGDRNRAERKQKRRRNYILMIAALAVIMLVLIGTLIFVLSSQGS